MDLFYKIISLNSNFLTEIEGESGDVLLITNPEPIVLNLSTNLNVILSFLTNAKAFDNVEDLKTSVLKHLECDIDESSEKLANFSKQKIELFLVSTTVADICEFSRDVVDLFDDSIVSKNLKEPIKQKFDDLESSTTHYFRDDFKTIVFSN
ncbi:hypothetical protein HOG98_08860 [bacterium]|jgi:hypothetical protein|nr:hypothetical protein [bacterium]